MKLGIDNSAMVRVRAGGKFRSHFQDDPDTR